MARIDVKNGESFEMKNPNVDTKEIERVAKEASGIILRAASPFLNSVKFFNKTKRCALHISFSEGVMVVAVENPDDEIFSLDDNGDMKQDAAKKTV